MNTTSNVSEVSVGSLYLPADIPCIILLTLIAGLGTANLGIVLCFVQDKSLRQPFNYIVLYMAIGNFLMSDVTAVMEIVNIARSFIPVGPGWCHAIIFLSMFSYTQSLLFITLMALVRTRSGLAKHHAPFSPRASAVCVSVVYAAAAAWGIVWMLPGMGGVETCESPNARPGMVDLSVAWLLYIAMVVVLFLVTVCSYATLILSMHCKNNMAANKKSEILTLKAALAVTGLFSVCYLFPNIIYGVNLGLTENEARTIDKLALSFGYLQSAVNPYIYLANNSRFRQIYRTTCCRALTGCTQRPRAVSDATNTGNTNTTATLHGQ